MGVLALSLIDAIVTAGLTTALGLGAFVVGQFALKLVVEPIQQQWRAVGGMAHALIYYRNVGPSDPHGPTPEREAEARRVYRDLAAEFRRNLRVVPRYEVFVRLGVVLPSDRVRRASAALIGLASTVHKGPAADDVNRYRFEVEKNLGIDCSRGGVDGVGQGVGQGGREGGLGASVAPQRLPSATP